MCGIAGYVGQGNEDTLRKMSGVLSYRGPDDQGFFINRHVGLAHNRLSIIDLSPLGHQPMANEDNSIQIIFNGEIYNYQDLKKDLLATGRHQFKSQTDTEVILHLYEDLGTDCFAKLNGMFALAIWDETKQALILARDRLGKKPLYWTISQNTIIFASEPKAILSHPLVRPELDLSALNKYLLYEYIPTPHSIFKNLHKLEPGHYLVFQNNTLVKKEKFWDISFNCSANESPITLAQAQTKLDDILTKAVNSRLVSDVPLGIFLSGGLDSSTVAYYATRGGQKIKTFSIGFQEPSFDESRYAREVAAYLGTKHHEKFFRVAEALDLVPHVFSLLDEPLADASILPTFLLAKFTREKVTVALGGDGGDELFCGYDTFIAHRLAKYYDYLPSWLKHSLIEKIIPLLPVSHHNLSLDFKAKKFISGYYGPLNYRNQRWLGSFDRLEREQLFKPEIWQELQSQNEFIDLDQLLLPLCTQPYFNRLIYTYLRTYLMDDILVKVDRASMYNSLEVRAPFLDYRLVDFVNSLPLKFKFKGLTTKYILRKLMADKLPASIINRKKKGFGLPLSGWLSGALKPLLLDIFSESAIKRAGLFNYSYLQKLLTDHFAKRRDNRKLLWTLTVFELWRSHWLDKK